MSDDICDQCSHYSVTTSDGIKLQGFCAKPEKSICSLIVVHGLGEHSTRYKVFAKKICAANCACYIYDQRGHGNSNGKRGHIENFENYSNDLLNIYDLVYSESEGYPIFLYGHSMGSIVAALFTIKHQTKIKGLILTGFPFEPTIPISGFALKLVNLLGKIAPLQKIPTFINVKHLSHDKKVWKDYKQDYTINKIVTLGWVSEFYTILEEVKNHLCKLRLPILVMHGGDDRIAKLKGAKRAFKTIRSNDKTLQIYEGQRHELLNEISPIPDKVTRYMKDWMQVRNRR